MHETPFCAWPWFHQNILTDGGVNPCCVWGGAVKRYSREDFFHGNFMSSLRQSFIDNQPHERCQKCIRNETTKGRSHRTYGFEIAKLLDVDFNLPPQLRSEEVNLSNVCNIKCRSCNQERSTKWIPDAVALGEESVGLLSSKWELSPSQAKTITRLQFMGGEPLLHQEEILEALNQIKKHGALDKLVLFINSNMTVAVCDELIELMSAMKKVNIGCSVDGVGDLNDYIRSDSQWNTIYQNLRLMSDLAKKFDHIKFNLVSVISVYNAHAYTDILDLADEFGIWINPIFLRVPEALDARNLPTEYKERLISTYNSHAARDKLQHITNHLKLPAVINTDDWCKKFVALNDVLDMRRNTQLKDVVPELDYILRET